MKLKRFTAVCLCAVLLAGSVLCACKKSDDSGATADEATTAATLVTSDSSETTPSASKAEATEASQAETKAETKPTSESTSETKATKPTKPSSQNSGQSGSSGSDSGSSQSKPVTCVITVDNKDHTVTLGDVVTYSYYLKTPKQIENVQATLNYPGTTLKLLDTVLTTELDKVEDQSELEKLLQEQKKIFPVLAGSVVYNAKNHNIIKFNASNISGMDFTKGENLITLRFQVISGIGGGISTNIEFMDEVGGNPYVDNSKFSKDVIHEERFNG